MIVRNPTHAQVRPSTHLATRGFLLVLAMSYLLVSGNGWASIRSLIPCFEPGNFQLSAACAGSACCCPNFSSCRAGRCCCSALEPVTDRGPDSTPTPPEPGASLLASRCGGGMPVDTLTGIAKVSPHKLLESRPATLSGSPRVFGPAVEPSLPSRSCEPPVKVPRTAPIVLW